MFHKLKMKIMAKRQKMLEKKAEESEKEAEVKHKIEAEQEKICQSKYGKSVEERKVEVNAKVDKRREAVSNGFSALGKGISNLADAVTTPQQHTPTSHKHSKKQKPYKPIDIFKDTPDILNDIPKIF